MYLIIPYPIMSTTYQRSVFIVLNKVAQWYTHTCSCRCCKFSVESLNVMKIKDSSLSEYKSDSSYDKANGESKIDSFTDKLIQKKIRKWKAFHSQEKLFPSKDSLQTSQTFSNNFFSEHNINVNNTQVSELLEMNRNEPLGKCNIIETSQNRCTTDNEEYCEYSDNEYKNTLNHTLNQAEEAWERNDFEYALNLFWNIFTENCMLQSKIRNVLNTLISKTISRKGEAVLVLIIDFSKKAANIHADYSFLLCVWENCFVSDWHSDNEIAASLVVEYPDLRNYIQQNVHRITKFSLTFHKIDITQRLFEVLLQYNMRTEYELVLRSLFDYACSMRDRYACSAIIQSCIEMDVTLTDKQKSRFLHLFCYSSSPSAIEKQIRTWTMKPSKFTFKF